MSEWIGYTQVYGGNVDIDLLISKLEGISWETTAVLPKWASTSHKEALRSFGVLQHEYPIYVFYHTKTGKLSICKNIEPHMRFGTMGVFQFIDAVIKESNKKINNDM